MILKELFKEHLDTFTLTVNDRICDAAEIMRREKIGSIIIVEDQKVIGILTDRDIAMCLALGTANPESLVGETMSSTVETINQSMSLLDVTRFFRKSQVKRLPVVDQDDRLVGVISTDDVMALLAREMFDTCSTLAPKLGHMV